MGELDRAQRQHAASALFEVSEFLQRRQIRHWLDFGTLLGAHRAQSIIPHDYDLDLTVDASSACIEQAVTELLSGGQFHRGDWESGARYQVVPKEGPLAIDLYLCARERTMVRMLQRESFSFPWFFIDELEQVTLEGFTFSAPRHRAQFLALRYGDDFMVPQSFCRALNLPWPEVQRNVGAVKSAYAAYVCGAFDLFHAGHLSLLRRMKGCFDRVIVGVQADSTVATYKQRPVIPYEQRRDILAGCRYVDQIIENAEPTIVNQQLDNLGADYFVVGRDSEALLGELYKGSAERLHIMSVTEEVSSSEIRAACTSRR